MSEYYRGNAIYDLIESTHNFRYTTENLWILVYGNRDCDPKVILLLSAYKNENYESKTLTPKESEIMIYTEQISHKSGVPFIYVRFNNDSEKLNEVKIMMNGRFKSISLDEYVNVLIGFGIQKNSQSCKKPINSHASNLYHLWQVNCGLDITTSDIDLMRVNSELEITEVYELKRSFISIEKWEPYSADFNNFILLSKLFTRCGVSFYIMFNQYQKSPFKDDIEKVKLYKVIYEKELKIINLGILNISSFFLEFKM